MATANGEAVQGSADPLRAVASAMASAAEAVRDGTGDAVSKARDAVPVVGNFVSKAVYSGCYYTSFGLVFPTMLAANFVPGGQVLASGLADGAAAACAAIRDRHGNTGSGDASGTTENPVEA